MLICSLCKNNRWGVDTHRIASGLDSGPLVLFDKSGASLIISPFSQFMAVSAEYSGNTVSWGLIGSMKKIPQDFRYSTILYYGDKGVRQVGRITNLDLSNIFTSVPL